MGHLLGYARVSTAEQAPALQVDALADAGCARVWTDVGSGARDDRPELGKMLEQLLPGDTLVVWRLDRLGRSLRHLIDTVTELDGRGVGFRSLQESIDTTTARSNWDTVAAEHRRSVGRHRARQSWGGAMRTDHRDSPARRQSDRGTRA